MHTEPTLRWASIGHGDVVERKSGPALQSAPGSVFYGVLGRDPVRAAAFATRFGVPQVYESLDAVLHDPLLEAVYVATPVASHAAYTLAAIEAGKHVLVEKPMAMTLAECRQMTAAAERQHVRLGVAYYRRSYPVVQRLRDLLQAGAIGQPLSAHIQVAGHRAAPAAGRSDWRTQPELSIGGCLADMGSHRLDMLLFLFGAGRVLGAATDAAAGGVEGCATVLAAFGSVQATCLVSWSAGAQRDSIEVIGTQGRIWIDELERGVLGIATGGRVSEEAHTPMQPVHLGLVADFVAAVRERRTPICSGEAGLATNELLLAAYAATQG